MLRTVNFLLGTVVLVRKFSKVGLCPLEVKKLPVSFPLGVLYLRSRAINGVVGWKFLLTKLASNLFSSFDLGFFRSANY